MKLERPNYFSDDDLQMELLYGPDGEFSPTSLNFWTDIYPNILEAYLSNHQPDKNYQDVFVDSNFYPLGVNQILRLCTRCFTELFTACFEKDLTHCENVSLSDEDIATLRNKKGLLGALGKITSNLAPLGRFNYRTLLYTLSQFDSNIIKLNEHLPKELYQDFVKEIKTPFYMLSDITGIKEIRKEIDKIVFLQHPQAISKIKKPHGYRLQKGEHCRSMIIFDNVEFGKKNQELFWDLVSFPGAFITMETVFFLNCKFSANYVSDRNWMRSRAVFRNCLFEKEFAPSSWLRESWKFINCTINGKLDFRNSEFEYGLWIDGCRFIHPY